MEPIEIMRNAMSDEQFEGFIIGNIYKYIQRYKHKGEPEMDLLKALDYMRALYRFHMDGNTKNPFRENENRSTKD